jgi:hypothetical protein
MSAHVFRKSEGAITSYRGREVKDGYFEHTSHPFDLLTSQQIEWAAFAKMQVERWIEGFREDLPERLWD